MLRGCARCGLSDEEAAYLAQNYLRAVPPAPWTLADRLGDFACEACGVDPIPEFTDDHSNEMAEALGVCLCESCARRFDADLGGDLSAARQVVDAAARRRSNESRCSPGCPAWSLFATSGRHGGDGVQVQRCDECSVIAFDEDAAALGAAHFSAITGCPMLRFSEPTEHAQAH
jgi:hypothetical protein